MEKELLKNLIENKNSIREISKKTGYSNGSVRYWINKFNLKTDGYKVKNDWTEENLKNAVNISECKTDVLKYLGIKIKSGNFQTLDKYLLKYNIDSSGLIYKNNRGQKWKRKYSNDEIFIKNSHFQTGKLKRRIIKDNLLKYECSECNNVGMWNNKKLVLQLDHINGINNDNRIENLRFLCPNCHSQTDTFCSKNI